MLSYTRSKKRVERSQSLPSEDYIVKAMPSTLSSLDMTAIYLIAIFWITNTTVAATAGPAALTYLILDGITFFIPCAIATAQLGLLFPHEGSIYNWTHKALGGYWSFFVGLCFWFPSVLAIVSGADAFVAYLQGLNSSWLVQPWQQGLVIVFLIALSGVLSIQRLRMVQNMVNVVIGLTFVAVFLIILSAVIWLASGHPSATNFSHLADWSPNPGNFSIFGLITFVYIGTNIPMNMGGEIKTQGSRRSPNIVTRHILWGTVIILAGYLLTIAAILVVEGPTAVAGASILSFAWVTMVDQVLGHVAGNITALCIMSFFVMASVVYNVALSRFLLVGGIDQRLPLQMGKLNKFRAPMNAIILQTLLTILFTIIVFIVVPSFNSLGKPLDLTTIVFNVSLASLTLIWTFATIFLFIDVVYVYRQDRKKFKQKLVVPLPVLWASVIIGPLACLATIVDTLLNSWIPQIGNDRWWIFVGALTLIGIIIAAIGSIVAVSEAAWQELESGAADTASAASAARTK